MNRHTSLIFDWGDAALSSEHRRWSTFMAIALLTASCETVVYDTQTARRSPDNGTVVHDIVVDNDDGVRGYVEQGDWVTSLGAGHYGSSSRWTATGAGDKWAAFTPAIGTAGAYLVFAWWVTGSNRAANVEYRVEHVGGPTSVWVDQANNGSKWNILGAFDFASGRAGNVVLTNDTEPGRVVSADAVRFQLARLAETIMDNTDPGFSASGSWTASDQVTGFWGDDYRRRHVEAISDVAMWRANLPVDGDYEVFARWTAAANRTAEAPYRVHHTGGFTTVHVNQRENGGDWVSLGVFNLQAGAADRVNLSCWTISGDYVIADAVRFVLQRP